VVVLTGVLGAFSWAVVHGQRGTTFVGLVDRGQADDDCRRKQVETESRLPNRCTAQKYNNASNFDQLNENLSNLLTSNDAS